MALVLVVNAVTIRTILIAPLVEKCVPVNQIPHRLCSIAVARMVLATTTIQKKCAHYPAVFGWDHLTISTNFVVCLIPALAVLAVSQMTIA